LLLGRTPLPDSNSWETYLQQGGKLAEKIQAYQQLQKLGGEVIYQGVDICNITAVQEIVQQTLSGWNTQQLDGVIHLAGLMQERLLMEETPESLAEVLRPKLLGTWVLHQLLEKRPKSLFINFSSINGFFGGTTVGAYGAANSFLDAFSYYQRDRSELQSYCLAWSMWDEMGMSRGYQMKQLTQAKGYFAVGLSQGMSSLLASLCHDKPYLMVGLDGGNLNIRRLTAPSDSLQQLTAYFTTNGKGTPDVGSLDHQVHDIVGKPSICAVVELAEMPLTEGGDIDIALLSQSNLGRSTQEKVKPRNELERQIAQIWQELLGVYQVGMYDNFFELGGNSLLATQVISRLRQALGNELTLQHLFESSTIAGIAKHIEVLRQGAQDDNTFSPLFPINPNGSKVPIFCVHPYSGMALCYIELAKLLGPEQPFYGLQALGLEKGQEPLTQVEDMANLYLPAIRQVQQKGPYILLGWSYGGYVALQMANELTAQGEQIAFLGLLDAWAPSELPDDDLLEEIIVPLFGGNISLPAKEFQKLTSNEQALLILKQARQDNLLPPDFELDDIKRFLEVLSLNLKAIREYSPPPYPGAMTLFRAEKGSLGLSQEVFAAMEPTLGWAKKNVGQVEVETVPGYHEYMVYKPNVTTLAQKLQVCIERSLKIM